MNKRYIYILFLIAINIYAQETSYKIQNKIGGSVNPSLYAFGDFTKVGVIYGSESINSESNIENKFAFINYFFEDYGFSIAADVNLLDVKNFGYSAFQGNLHYIYKSTISNEWVFNPAISVGFGNKKLDFNSLVFEDQINVLTGSITGVSIDPVRESDNVSYIDVGAGALIHNNYNFFVGFNVKHINQPKVSYNSEAKDKKELFVSLQSGYEFDLNPYKRGALPSNSYLYLYGTVSKYGKNTRLDLFQEAIFENFSFGINQHFNNYDSFSFNSLGTSISFFLEQFEIGANYSFELGNKQMTTKSYNIFEIFLTFDLSQFNDRRGDYSRFYNL